MSGGGCCCWRSTVGLGVPAYNIVAGASLSGDANVATVPGEYRPLFAFHVSRLNSKLTCVAIHAAMQVELLLLGATN